MNAIIYSSKVTFFPPVAEVVIVSSPFSVVTEVAGISSVVVVVVVVATGVNERGGSPLKSLCTLFN